MQFPSNRATKILYGRIGRRRLFLERLEPRLNFSPLHAAAETLVIDGTGQSDDISLTYDSAHELVYATKSNQLIGTYSIHDWNSIRVDAGQGDDRIHVDPNLPLPVDVAGGDGIDTLFGVRLNSGNQVLFASGESLSFDNRYCIAVECVRSPEGERSQSQANSDPAVPGILRPGLTDSDHSHDGLSGVVWASSGEMDHTDNTISQLGSHEHAANMLALAVSTPTHSTMTMPYYSGAGSFARRAHSTMPGRGSAAEDATEPIDDHVPSESVIGAQALPSIELPGELEENIDALLAGWTDGSDGPSSDVPVPVQECKAQAAVPVVPSVAATEAVFGVPDVVAEVFPTPGSMGDNRGWSVSGAIGIAIIAAGGACLLDRKAARSQNTSDSVTGSLPVTKRPAKNFRQFNCHVFPLPDPNACESKL